MTSQTLLRRPVRSAAARSSLALAAAAVTLIVPGCGDDDTSRAGDDETPVFGTPEEWCENGQAPQAAAFDIDDGTIRWVSCTDGRGHRTVRAVTGDAVYVDTVDYNTSAIESTALNPADGTPVTDAPPPPPANSHDQLPVNVDGYRVHGGATGPVSVANNDGTPLWSQPGRWVSSDVWAIDDGAVFAIESDIAPAHSSRLVAYEIPTGDIRWEHVGNPYEEGLWPQYADDGRLYTTWANVEVRDTETGDLIWTTDYPFVQSPVSRFSGAAADDDTLYVGYSTASAPGD